MVTFYSILMAGIIGAITASICSYYFNYQLAKRNEKQQRKTKELDYIENMCEQLLEMTIDYWTVKKDGDNVSQLIVHEIKMGIFINEISKYMYSKIGNSEKVNSAVRNLSKITAGNFGESRRAADKEIAHLGAGYAMVVRQIIITHEGKL